MGVRLRAQALLGALALATLATPLRAARAATQVEPVARLSLEALVRKPRS